MAEAYIPFDEYVDQYVMSANAYGVSMNFQKSSPKPISPGSNPVMSEIGTIRMSLEHFKILAYLLKKQVNDIEAQLGIEIPLPVQLMGLLKIAPEDWQTFWKRSE
jgi:hypothetical protein